MVRVIIFFLLFPFIDHVEWWLFSIEWLFSCVCKLTLDINKISLIQHRLRCRLVSAILLPCLYHETQGMKNDVKSFKKSLKVSLTALSHICECFMSREKPRRGRQSLCSEKWGNFSLVASVFAALFAQRKLPHTDRHEYITPGELGRLHKIQRSFQQLSGALEIEKVSTESG